MTPEAEAFLLWRKGRFRPAIPDVRAASASLVAASVILLAGTARSGIFGGASPAIQWTVTLAGGAGAIGAPAFMPDGSAMVPVIGISYGGDLGISSRILRVDSGGTVRSDWGLPAAPGASAVARALAVSPDGAIFAGGMVISGGIIYGGGGTGQAWIAARVDAGGAVAWTRSFTAPVAGNASVQAVAVRAGGGAFFAGRVAHPELGRHEDWLVEAMDGGGRLVWSASFDGDGHGSDEAVAAVGDSSGGVIVAGFAGAAGGAPGGDRWVVSRWGPGGALLWSHEGPGSSGRPCAVVLAAGGRILVGGAEAGVAVVRGFEPHGAPCWTVSLSGCLVVSGMAVLPDGGVIASLGTTGGLGLARLSGTGRILWTLSPAADARRAIVRGQQPQVALDASRHSLLVTGEDEGGGFLRMFRDIDRIEAGPSGRQLAALGFAPPPRMSAPEPGGSPAMSRMMEAVRREQEQRRKIPLARRLASGDQREREIARMEAQRAGPELLADTVAMLRSTDPAERRRGLGVVQYLTRKGDREAVAPDLAPLLNDQDPLTRAEAARWMCGPAAAGPLAARLDDPDGMVRLRASAALIRSGGDADGRAAGTLEAFARTASGKAMTELLREMMGSGQSGRQDSLLPAARVLLSRADLSGNGEFAEMLRMTRLVVKLVPELTRMTKDPDPVLRRRALSMLALSGSRPTGVFAAALADRDAGVRLEAARWIGWMAGDTERKPDPGFRAAMPALRRMLGDSDSTARYRAAEALGAMAGRELDAAGVSALAGVLGDPDRMVREAAAAGIGKSGRAAAGAVPALVKALSDQGTAVAAAHALGEIGPAARRALPALRKAAESTDDLLATAATIAVIRVTEDDSWPSVAP